ncbi:hypothetical protein EBR16_02450 [bacterium]|jgi:hypothetical protein|nr:hypothetical protein [bacterium]
MSATPATLSAHWKKFLFAGLAALAVVWSFAFAAAAHGDHRGPLSVVLGALFWVATLIGVLMLTMITRVFDAGWAPVIRRTWELVLPALPIVLLLSVVPMALVPKFRHLLWEWTNAEHVLPSGHAVGHDPILQAKSWFLNEGFFLARITYYVVFFAVLVWALRRGSFAQDTDRTAGHTHRLHAISAAGIPLAAVSLTMLAFDCLMALSYHWFSTMYGVWFFALSIRLALAFTVIATYRLSNGGWLDGILNQAHRHVLGCLMLAFTVFWAYISFSQYFLIYTANIPEETFWYNIREFDPVTGAKNQWWGVSLYLIFGFFLLPFLSLLFYRTKIVAGRLLAVASLIFVGGLVDLWFNAVPRQINAAGTPEGFVVSPFLTSYLAVDVLAVLGFGALVVAVLLRAAGRHETIPVHDPRILESINYHE